MLPLSLIHIFKEADPVTAMITAADTLPGISAYPAEVRASEENGVYRLEKVYYLTAKDDPTTIPTADFEREGRTYTPVSYTHLVWPHRPPALPEKQYCSAGL